MSWLFYDPVLFPLKNKKQAPTSPCCPRAFLSVDVRKFTHKPGFCSARRDTFLVVLPDSGKLHKPPPG